MAEIRAAERLWTVSEWMSPVALSIPPHMSMSSAFFKMKVENIRHLPVIDDGQLVGIVTDRDLRAPHQTFEGWRWEDLYDFDDEREVHDVMTREVITVRPTDAIEKAVELMLENKFGALPVQDELGAVVGMLTSHDLLAALDEALAEIRTSIG